MEKFIQTVRKIYPKNYMAFQKAIQLLHQYAIHTKNETAFLPVYEDAESISIFKTTIKGLNRDSEIQWVKYLNEIFEATAKKLIDQKVLATTEDFYSIFCEPRTKDEHDQNLSVMKKIFDEMSIVVEEKIKTID